MLTRSVCDAVDPPRPRRKEMATLDAPEVQRLLDAAAGSPYGPVIYLTVYTGMSRGELLGLRWSVVEVTCPPRTGPSVMLVTWTVGRGRNAKEEGYTRAGHQQAA